MYIKVVLKEYQEDGFLRIVNIMNNEYEEMEVISVNYIKNKLGELRVVYLINIRSKILGDYSFIIGDFIEGYLNNETFRFKLDKNTDTLITCNRGNVILVNNVKTFDYCKKIILLFSYFLSKRVRFISNDFFETISRNVDNKKEFKKVVVNEKGLDNKNILEEENVNLLFTDKNLIILMEDNLLLLNNLHVEDNIDIVLRDKKYKNLKLEIIKNL